MREDNQQFRQEIWFVGGSEYSAEGWYFDSRCLHFRQTFWYRFVLLTFHTSAQEPFEFDSKNPVLQNIHPYLIEEGSAEEDELLGHNEPIEETDEKDPVVFKASIFLVNLLSFY